MVQTVLGPVASDQLGITLMHEHLLLDARHGFVEPREASRIAQAYSPVRPEILRDLRQHPYGNLDNCGLLDEQAAVEEVALFHAAGGRSVLDPTCRGMGRDPAALVRIASRTGLNVIMGTGFYLERSHPPEFADMTLDQVADLIVRDVTEGVDDTGIRAGVIGEIGVGPNFTPAEQKSLRAAAQAQARTGVALTIHMPGWERLGHQVLDIVEEEGADLSRTILDHMNPSGGDIGYQTALADRGAYLEYDMIGLDYYFANEVSQSPSDPDNSANIMLLVERGYAEKLLLSHDVFLKMMLTRHGGNGYAYILDHFVPRLLRDGMPRAIVDQILIENPARVLGA